MNLEVKVVKSTGLYRTIPQSQTFTLDTCVCYTGQFCDFAQVQMILFYHCVILRVYWDNVFKVSSHHALKKCQDSLLNVFLHSVCVMCGRAQTQKDKWHLSACLRLLQRETQTQVMVKAESSVQDSSSSYGVKKIKNKAYCSLFLQWGASPFPFTEAAIHFRCPEPDSDAFNFIIRRNAVETVTERQNFSPKRITAQSFHI